MISDARDKVIEDWLSKSANDLKSAKVLYDRKLFDTCVYHLQQSNEKLAKALLLSMGILTSKEARENWTVRKWLGFLPKQPQAYGHRTTRFLISDLEKSVPSIEAFLTLMKNSALEPRITGFLEGVRSSKKDLKKLKKKVFGLIETTEQLEIEVRAAQAILDALDEATDKAEDELDKLDTAELVPIATSLALSVGYKVDTTKLPSFDKVKDAILPRIRLSALAMLSAALASFLDPLVSVTRYPDSQHGSFDENNPYIKNFMGLHDVIACILQKSRTVAHTFTPT
jgi:hypothetical protein